MSSSTSTNFLSLPIRPRPYVIGGDNGVVINVADLRRISTVGASTPSDVDKFYYFALFFYVEHDRITCRFDSEAEAKAERTALIEQWKDAAARG